MKLKYQLFIVLLLASATLIATLFVFNSWSFNRGFAKYLNRSQTSSLEALATTLAEAYAESTSWDWIEDNNSQWRRITGHALRRMDGMEDRLSTPPSRSDDPNIASSNQKVLLNQPRSNRQNRPPPPLILADNKKKALVGKIKADRKVTWFPINVDGSVVGYVGYASSKGLPGQLERVFADQQKKNLALVSLLMVAVSALLAALLAARIVKPVVTVSQAMGEINRGDYEQRVDTVRRDELGDLSRDVNQLAHTLEQNRIARRNWIAEISHELRTPVAILQGEIEAIEDGIRAFDITSLKSLQAETTRLSRLIQDLHDLSLSDLGALEYQMSSMCMEELIKERIISIEAQRLETGISIDLIATTGRTEILGDTQRLGQLINNLLQNSLRYTEPNGKVIVELNQLDNQLQIRWFDSGPGLTDADLPQLFDPLFRAEKSRNRNNGGAGLGLTIVSKIVRAHHGTVSASHSSIGGLEITILIPINDMLHISKK
ncbi:MAG: two-component system sensor histidine kinase BaeS [Granulosicoccus sp.]|jgi:two-component system sensor histidine kinase BaeS